MWVLPTACLVSAQTPGPRAFRVGVPLRARKHTRAHTAAGSRHVPLPSSPRAAAPRPRWLLVRVMHAAFPAPAQVRARRPLGAHVILHLSQVPRRRFEVRGEGSTRE